MELTVNGEKVQCPEGSTLLDLLQARSLDPKTVVAERNRDIVPAENFGAVCLQEGDTLELLHFVGGG